MSSIEKKIGKGVIFQFFSFIITGAIGVLFIPFTISKFGKVQYGIFEMVFSLNIINAVLDIGIGSTITNYCNKFLAQGTKVFQEFFWTFFWFKFGLSLIGFLICLLLYFNTGLIYRNIELADLPLLRQGILWFGVGVVILNINTFLTAIQNGLVRFDLSSISNIFSKLVYILIFFFWFYTWQDNTIVGFIVITFIFVPLVRLIIQLYQIYHIHPNIISRPSAINIDYLKETKRYIGGISIVTVLAQVYNYGSQLILGFVANPIYVGEYGIIKKILSLMTNISNMLIRPLMPAAGELRKKYKVNDLVLNGTKIHAIVMVSLAVILMGNGYTLSEYYLGGKYSGFSLHLIIMCVPFIIPGFIVMLMLYYGEGKSRISVINNLLNTIVSLSLAFVMFYYIGFLGLLLGLVIGGGLIKILNLNRFFSYYRDVDRLTYIKIYFRQYIIAFICLILYFFIMKFIGYSIQSIIFWNITAITILAGSAFVQLKSQFHSLFKKV